MTAHRNIIDAHRTHVADHSAMHGLIFGGTCTGCRHPCEPGQFLCEPCATAEDAAIEAALAAEAAITPRCECCGDHLAQFERRFCADCHGD